MKTRSRERRGIGEEGGGLEGLDEKTVSRTTLNAHTAIISGSNNSQMCRQAVAGAGLSNELMGSDQSFGCQSCSVLCTLCFLLLQQIKESMQSRWCQGDSKSTNSFKMPVSFNQGPSLIAVLLTAYSISVLFISLFSSAARTTECYLTWFGKADFMWGNFRRNPRRKHNDLR